MECYIEVNDLETLNIKRDSYEKECLNEENYIVLKVPASFESKLPLDFFLKELPETSLQVLSKNWLFDEDNFCIYSPKEEHTLTNKECKFLKMLLNNKIISYQEMHSTLWYDQEDVSMNALVLFVRNIKRKLPKACIKNFQGIGYKFVNQS